MFAIQLVDVEDVTMSSDAWRLPSFADVLIVDGTDVVDGRSGVDTLVVDVAEIVEGSA